MILAFLTSGAILAAGTVLLLVAQILTPGRKGYIHATRQVQYPGLSMADVQSIT